ncbi:YggT family protein [Conyzicola nivalis]|uniref:YggT family protein n=1 Tax=Conyzicola nivalis TaxID=1477021 RepID=A0A916SCT7_9MICO|nr:YggT family protein [Conyzicola nivalis]GGA94164.1 YggT family protein [Conyzicola nivalis]
MNGVSVIATIIYVALNIFVVVMWARFVLDLVAMLARDWRPRGFVLVLAELAYTITDPPVKAVRKIVPPLRAGGIQIDFSWSIVLIATIILSYIVAGFIN